MELLPRSALASAAAGTPMAVLSRGRASRGAVPVGTGLRGRAEGSEGGWAPSGLPGGLRGHGDTRRAARGMVRTASGKCVEERDEANVSLKTRGASAAAVNQGHQQLHGGLGVRGQQGETEGRGWGRSRRSCRLGQQDRKDTRGGRCMWVRKTVRSGQDEAQPQVLGGVSCARRRGTPEARSSSFTWS